MSRSSPVSDAEFIRLAGLLSCVELAHEMQVTPSAITQRVKRLRKRGLMPACAHRWGDPYWEPSRARQLAPNV